MLRNTALLAGALMVTSAAMAAEPAPAAAPVTLSVPVAPSTASVQEAGGPTAAKAGKAITVNGTKDPVAPWNGEKIVCTRVAPIGSLIPVRRCTTASEDRANHRAIEEIARKPIQNDFSN